MLNDSIQEVIFVGWPGPTHHYGGLSGDNVAATASRGDISHPAQAARQTLELIRLLQSLGQTVAVLPPQLRPHLPLLREHFAGADDEVIRQAAREKPELLEKAASSSAMWTANAATATPAVDSADGMLHITPANLFTHLHRRIEAADTYRVLAAIFREVPRSIVHPPPAAGEGSPDEGAANHMRLSPRHADKGLHIFVYGENGRQSLSASQVIKTEHEIPDAEALFIRQNPEAVRQGVFHNDVIAVSNAHVLIAHERAYARADFSRIAQAYTALHPGKELAMITIGEEALSVEEAVRAYVFNSQIVTTPNGMMAMIAPMETKTLYGGKAAAFLERVRAGSDNPIDEVHYVDLRQSMKNGGGPACLRLRVPMTAAQVAAMQHGTRVLADEALLSALEKNIEKYYPEALSPQDLGNPELYHGCKALLAELSAAMGLPLL
ncbi:MAG: N-succinylarginine dihydrolase [Pseudomonadota bacterium]|nr:N-succinylarginine dihydrolase [Pseudomonadota bacterium]MDE3038703.1 N-succinylarginine dihydrolase [Pseudomonadota bacterium]